MSDIISIWQEWRGKELKLGERIRLLAYREMQVFLSVFETLGLKAIVILYGSLITTNTLQQNMLPILRSICNIFLFKVFLFPGSRIKRIAIPGNSEKYEPHCLNFEGKCYDLIFKSPKKFQLCHAIIYVFIFTCVFACVRCIYLLFLAWSWLSSGLLRYVVW
jgi:hypothetical protein